ncbi:MAG: hypothetical protein OXH82_06925 [Candidatus Dadabacteria bacterium]|nr:hypothetical protein [Candidatus Dadabacteria bacterium]MDE0663639.1 hypothetical protein [Candidatus Dadabacteria bacterium]
MTEKERRELLELYGLKKEEIQNRLLEFRQAFREADDLQIFRELSFCILTSGVGPKIAGQCMSAIGEKLVDGEEDGLLEHIGAIHKYAENASRYIVFTREYLREEYGFLLKSLVDSFEDRVERRDFFAKNPGIKGLGYMQASHFLRNLGFSGYAILDRNNLASLFELGIIGETKYPLTRKRYLETESLMTEAAHELGISLDEFDLLLWSRKRKYVPR